MEGIRRESASARALADALGGERFTLIDIGCSGGIDKGWETFGDRLTAYGFDPGQYEIQRLREAETRPGVHYVNAFVGLPPGHPFRNANKAAWRTNPWQRLAVHRTVTLQKARDAGEPQPGITHTPRPTPEQLAYEAAYFEEVRDVIPGPDADKAADAGADQADLMSRNQWTDALLADSQNPVVMSHFLAKEGLADVDFIKIDVDGPDFDILRSLGDVLDDGKVLGAVLEVNYIGSDNEHHNTFHNTDRFMRAHGFDLVDLSIRRYGLAALPSTYNFVHPIAAQSVRGRPIQGDALYIRDFGYPSNGPDPAAWSDAKLIKTAAICALFGLLDHAAEILVNHRDRLSGHLDVDAVLDLITREVQGLDPEIDGDFPPFPSYAALIAAYEADHPAFYGANTRRHDNARQPVIDLEAAQREIAGFVSYEDEVLTLRRRVEELDEIVRGTTGSTVWKLTAPLRLVMARLKGRG